MFKKIAIVATLILTVGLGIFLWSTSREEEKQVVKQEQEETKRRPLVVKKQELEKKLNDLNKKHMDRWPSG